MEIKSASRHDTVEVSRFEASLAKVEVARRPNSVQANDIDRHAEAGDVGINELDFDFNLDTGHYPLNQFRSLQEVFSAVQYESHLQNFCNFSDATDIKCFETDGDSIEWHHLDSYGFNDLLKRLKPNKNGSSTFKPPTSASKLLVFFVPLTPAPNTSFGSRAAMTQSNVSDLFQTFRINPLYLLNLIGRPDYWAPQTPWETDESGRVSASDFFCQHPRWDLRVQGAPLSVYLRYIAASNTTVYVISHKEGDTIVRCLQSLLGIAQKTAASSGKNRIFMDDPFDLAVILSTLSFEASKYHLQRFRRFMWAEFNKIDDVLAGFETSDRGKLGELTKKLQVISRDADSHVVNADVAIITANAIRTARTRLLVATSKSSIVNSRATDSIDYVIKSVEKQKIWFLNYKSRKDGTMGLVYNLVTQQDAANNLQLSNSMKRDSTSMNAIAALTMIFLPGTFTASVLQAGIFTVVTGSHVRVGNIWWLWIALTIPLTLIVVACWWQYKRVRGRQHKTHEAKQEETDLLPPKSRKFPISSASFLRRRTTASAEV